MKIGHDDWLLNLIEELELEVNDWRVEAQKWQKFYEESEESHSETKELLKSIVNQNKRYREALEYVSNELDHAYTTGIYEQKDELIIESINVIDKALEEKE